MRLLLSLSISLVLTMGATLGDEPSSPPPINLTSMQSEYNKGHYPMTQYIGAKLLQQEPSNIAIHYLLGNCYVKFNQLDKATAEYKFCAQLGLGSQIGTFAQTALDQIRSINSQAQASPETGTSSVAGSPPNASASTAPAAGSLPGSGSGPGNGESPAPADPPPDKMDLQTLEYKERLLKTGADLIAANKVKLRRQIETIHSQTQLAIHGVSDQGGGLAFAEQDRLTQEASVRIKELEKTNAAEEEKITAYYRAQAEAISSQKGNLTSQAQTGNGDVRLEPKGTSLFVRNFVNYHGEVPLPPPPPELRAKALKLNADPAKRAKPAL